MSIIYPYSMFNAWLMEPNLNFMKELFDKMKGKKTFTVAAVMVIYAISALLLGKIDGNGAVTILLEAAALAGIRDAIR